jgi:hypothetical protein
MQPDVEGGGHLHLIERVDQRNGLAEGVDFVCAGMATPKVLLHTQEFTRRQFTIQVSRQ